MKTIGIGGRYGTAAREARRTRNRHNKHAHECGYDLVWGAGAYPAAHLERGKARAQGTIAKQMMCN